MRLILPFKAQFEKNGSMPVATMSAIFSQDSAQAAVLAQRINPCPIHQTSVKVLPLFAFSKHTWKFLI